MTPFSPLTNDSATAPSSYSNFLFVLALFLLFFSVINDCTLSRHLIRLTHLTVDRHSNGSSVTQYTLIFGQSIFPRPKYFTLNFCQQFWATLSGLLCAFPMSEVRSHLLLADDSIWISQHSFSRIYWRGTRDFDTKLFPQSRHHNKRRQLRGLILILFLAFVFIIE